MFWIKTSRKIALFNPSKVFHPLSFNPLQHSHGGETEAQPGLQDGRFPVPTQQPWMLPGPPPPRSRLPPYQDGCSVLCSHRALICQGICFAPFFSFLFFLLFFSHFPPLSQTFPYHIWRAAAPLSAAMVRKGELHCSPGMWSGRKGSAGPILALWKRNSSAHVAAARSPHLPYTKPSFGCRQQ